jgi:hypothetical protein
VSFLREAPHHPLPPLVTQEVADIPAGHRSTKFIKERCRRTYFPPPPVPSLHSEHLSSPTCPMSPLQRRDGHPTHARLALVRRAAGKLAATVPSTCSHTPSAASIASGRPSSAQCGHGLGWVLNHCFSLWCHLGREMDLAHGAG